MLELLITEELAKSSQDCVNKLVGPNKNIMLYADTSRGREFSKDPDVVNFKGKYYMYYSIPPFKDGRQNDGWAVGIARSDVGSSGRKLGNTSALTG